MRRMACALAFATALAAASSGIAYADNSTNGSCSTPEAVSVGTYYYGGVSYPSDYQDFYSFTASAGQYVSATMNPGYSSGTGEVNATFHANPGCYVAGFDYEVGTAIESPGFVAPYTGTYYLEIWAQWGYGYYDFVIYTQNPGASRSCSSSSLVGGPGVPSCTVTFPVCPTTTCDYSLQVDISGGGTVEGRFGNAWCQQVASCTGYGYASWPTASELCFSGPNTLAVDTRIQCKATLTSF